MKQVLIDNQNTDYVIQIDKNAGKTVVFAAKELVKYICKCTKVTMNVVTGPCEKSIYLYVKDDATCPDGFSVKTVGGNIELCGFGKRGIIYAAYDFLERVFGVRFLAKDCEYTPFSEKVEVDIADYTSVPAFPIRSYYSKNVCNEDFSTKLRMCDDIEAFGAERGGSLEWTWGNHASLYYVPKQIYYTKSNREENAHMYCLKNGEPIDLCMTDGLTDDGEWDKSIRVSTFSVALESLKRRIIMYPNAKYFSFCQMDHLEACECERCKQAVEKYKRSGVIIRFANCLLRETRKWLEDAGLERDVHLVVFAYNYSEVPPTKTVNGKEVLMHESVKADKNLHVRIAPISTNCYYPLSSHMHFKPYKKMIDDWGLVCDKLMFWTYHTNYKCYPWYFPTMQHWKEDLQYLRSLNAEYVFMQSNHTESVDWKADMELYVASKMLWNPSGDVMAIRDEYIDLYFEETAPFIKEILQIFDDNYKRIAKESEAMRKELYRQANNGEDIENFEGQSTEELLIKLRKEADIDWKKNVYFSIYHYEIMWAKEQPKELLERQLALLTKAKETVENSQRTAEEKAQMIHRLEKVEITVRMMILYNFDTYYPNQTEEKEAFKNAFFDVVDRCGMKGFGEGLTIEKLKEDFRFHSPYEE